MQFKKFRARTAEQKKFLNFIHGLKRKYPLQAQIGENGFPCRKCGVMLVPTSHEARKCPKCKVWTFKPTADEGLGFEVERFNGEDGVEVLIRDTDSPEWTSGLAWAKTSPETIVTMLADAYEALTRNSEKCNVPPQGWWCSREKGHEGPCAARRAGLSSQEGT